MKRSKHSLSHYQLLSMDMGELVPIGVMEVLPGDTIQHATNAMVRASPLLAPVMHPVHISIRHFFVPNRLMWDGWEDFITGGADGMDTSVPPTIQLSAATTPVGNLPDYLGIPTLTSVKAVSALPFRAYQMIWNEYYRDQDLQSEASVVKTGGNDTTTSILLRNVNWEKDYFTTARPWEQKGPAINVPTSTTGAAFNVRATSDPNTDRVLNAIPTQAVQYSGAAVPANSPLRMGSVTGQQVNIQMLREAFALQRFEEARARYGSRYTEYLRYLGVQSSDARLQRPEYLGGGTNSVQFSEVLQTAEGTDPVGDLKGHGIAAMRSNRYRRYFEEHGIVISLMHIRPKAIYMNGLHRMWSKRVKEDYFQKELEHIGQQEVLMNEIYINATDPNAVFGFNDRYQEYRQQWSRVSGEFRTTLNYWHMARDLGSQPALNSGFITCSPAERSFAVPGQDVFYVMANHSIQARRIISQSASSSFVL